MKQLKAKFLLLLVMVMVILSSITAFAGGEIQPRWTYMIMVSAGMEIDDYNSATISVDCSCEPYTTDSMKVTCELQQFIDGKWKTIKTWTKSDNDSVIVFTKYYAVPKGYSYRNRITAKAYKNGTLLETVTENFDYGYYQ